MGFSWAFSMTTLASAVRLFVAIAFTFFWPAGSFSTTHFHTSSRYYSKPNNSPNVFQVFRKGWCIRIEASPWYFLFFFECNDLNEAIFLGFFDAYVNLGLDRHCCVEILQWPFTPALITLFVVPRDLYPRCQLIFVHDHSLDPAVKPRGDDKGAKSRISTQQCRLDPRISSYRHCLQVPGLSPRMTPRWFCWGNIYSCRFPFLILFYSPYRLPCGPPSWLWGLRFCGVFGFSLNHPI